MKTLKVISVIMVAAFLTICSIDVSEAQTFHSGGVAYCDGCHSMHQPKAGGASLLQGIDPSSTCLICHEHAGDTGPTGWHISTALTDMPNGIPPKQRTPGGDFGWLKKNYTFTVSGTTTNESGDTHGHNIVATDFGYAADATNTTGVAPGGTFPLSQLACNSCHDQHGKYRRLNDGTVATGGAPIIASGSYDTNSTPSYAEPPAAGTALGVYRLLAGSGYSNKASGTIGFTGVPAAKVPGTYNQTEATNQVRAAYGVGTSSGHVTWGVWCATCHAKTHSINSTVHPVDQALGVATTLANYNSYVKSGDLSGAQATSFSSLAPFATNSNNYATLAGLAANNAATYAGPLTGDQVTCLSCHRAHASGWTQALRWNMGGTFMVYNSLYPGTDTTPTVPELARGRTSTETLAAYYDRPVSQFASYQRVYCNKCHAKD